MTLLHPHTDTFMARNVQLFVLFQELMLFFILFFRIVGTLQQQVFFFFLLDFSPLTFSHSHGIGRFKNIF